MILSWKETRSGIVNPDERLPWSDAAPLLLILSIAGWGGLILLWNLVF